MNPSNKNDIRLITAVVSNSAGKIFELEGYAAVGMEGGSLVPLTLNETVYMPSGGELMFLPERMPILYDTSNGRFETLKENPYVTGEDIFPVAAFNSPGYVISQVSAYEEKKTAGYLPLFSYGAVGWHQGRFRSAALQVDRERRQDLRLMKEEEVIAGIQRMRKQMPRNRLRKHLEKCALTYGCPAGKNFFLGRYEAPLPTSRKCNAKCLGCLSLQKKPGIPASQKRISFVPTAEEISEIALVHIRRVNKSIVSFGQGCEGDPLLSADVIEPAIRKIRSETKQGTININTNGSRPGILEDLFAAGLDSVRISMNSVREDCYHAYFRPAGYRFADVAKSIDIAVRAKKFVSINYLNSPGFTDAPEEVRALLSFVKIHKIDMIQWRNLNFDPVRYWRMMNAVSKHGKPIGIEKTLNRLKNAFPHLKCGYFNPPQETFGRFKSAR